MDYLDMAVGSAQALTPEIVKYVDQEARFLPVRITHDGSQYALLGASGNNSQLFLVEVPRTDINVQAPKQVQADEPFAVNDCVSLCQKILGLKINEIAKLVGVSRATLDLHRKGANVKDMTDYQKVFDFVLSIEATFGDSIKVGVRNVLVKRKTLLQHFMLNKDNLNETYSYIEEVAAKLGNVNTIQTEIDGSKANSRLAGIGRMA